MALPKIKLPSGLSGGLKKLSYRQMLMLSALAALLCGALVLFLLPGGDEEQQAQEEAAAPARVKVVVAKQDIQPRTLVKETMLEVVEMPPDILPEGAVTDMVAVIDRPASVPIQKGDILTDKKVLVDPRMAGFTGLIPENCRAMSVPITDVTGIAGFARPGDYVDVMVVSKGQNRIEGEIVLQNVLLLGINKTGGDGTQAAQSASGDKDKEKKDDKDSKDKDKEQSNPSEVKASSDAMATATLAVTPDDALKLAVASQKGTVYLVLRPFHPKDVFTVNTDYFMLTDKGQQAQSQPAAAPAPSYTPPAQTQSAAPSYTPSPAASAPAPAPVEAGNGIEVFRGTKSSVE
ncbi:Flp pilus assembly protein CpaB [uncultured Selenomonas sp.]|uniref:Flp pilus assembly protein CpaB n=1 Tax=uncultured Selenomonas sp. TaxID=159275 RepID=UPI0025D342A7|nr:Flp pilus assembly protein CpaB [uncultured Selenomonas sp.]